MRSPTGRPNRSSSSKKINGRVARCFQSNNCGRVGNIGNRSSSGEALDYQKLEPRKLLATLFAADNGNNSIDVETAFVGPQIAADVTQAATIGDVTTDASPHAAAFVSQQTALNLPEGLPETFSVEVEYEGERLTLDLEKNSAFGENTRFLIDDGSGNLVEVDYGVDRSYIGAVVGYPGSTVSALLTEAGLSANINRPNQEPLIVEPVSADAGNRVHQVSTDEAAMPHDHDGDGIPDHLPEDHGVAADPHEDGCCCDDCLAATSQGDVTAASTGPITTTALGSVGAPQSVSPILLPATLPPSAVLDVLEFEVGVEIGSAAFLNNYSGSTVAQKLVSAMAEVQKIPGNLDARYLHAAGVKHRLGTVIIRTSAAEDKFNVANGNDNGGLDAFRSYWNNNPQEVGNTHDLAVYHVRGGPSGLAFVGTAGTSSGYALSASNGPSSWADGTLVHEFGHSWSLSHVGTSTANGLFYENRPRNNNGSSTAGGNAFFISPMHGSGNHNIGRFATDEANRIFNLRESRRSQGDLVTNPGPIKPFGHRDAAATNGTAIAIDVIANDYDFNNDVLDAQLLDTVSFLGGTILLAPGTGPGGRNQLVYIPPANTTGSDFFHYTVVDSTGRTDWGAVHIENTAPPVTNFGAYQFDFGPNVGGVFSGTSVAGEILPANLAAADSFFNAVDGGDVDFNSILNAQGNVSGVTLKLRETVDGGTFDFDAPGNNLGSRTFNATDNPTGIYDTPLLNDLIFTNQGDDLGLQLEGLAAGTYSVTALIQETLASATSRTYSVDIGAGSGSTATFGDFGLGNDTSTPASAPVDFVDDQNYYTETVTVSEGQSIFVLIDSTNSDFVSLQGLQVVALTPPPPPTYGGVQFDFGPNTGGAFFGTSVAGENLPAMLPAADSFFNAVDGSDVNFNNVLDTKGNATNATLTVRETVDGGTFNFDAPGSALGSRTLGASDNPTGIYNTPLLNDLIFTNQGDDLGLRLEGLSPGTYAVTALIQETLSSATTRTYSVDIGTGNGPTATFGDFGLGNQTVLPASAPATFIDNQNFYTETITVTAGQSVFVLIDSTNSDFVSLQGLQVVALTPPVVVEASIESRHVFYNNSFHDGNDAAANADDDGAIATDKSALLPGQAATFSNYTSYEKGINGVILDIANLANAAALSAADFQLSTGNGNSLNDFTSLTTAPVVSVRTGAGVGGSDRVSLILPNGLVTGTWLSVTVLANDNTGLTQNDVFYFGNAIGDTGNSTFNSRVTASDEIGAHNNPRNFTNRAGVTDVYDFNRDSLVTSTDEMVARNNNTNFLSDLNLIVAPNGGSQQVTSSVSQPVRLALQAAPAGSSEVEQHLELATATLSAAAPLKIEANIAALEPISVATMKLNRAESFTFPTLLSKLAKDSNDGLPGKSLSDSGMETVWNLAGSENTQRRDIQREQDDQAFVTFDEVFEDQDAIFEVFLQSYVFSNEWFV